MAASIREARFADSFRIAEIHVEASRVAFEGVLPRSELDRLCPRDMATRWAPLTLTHGGGLIVAEDHQVLGFCYVTPARGARLGEPTVEMLALYVDPSRQSEGIGGKLVSAGVDFAHDRGFTDMMLWVLPGNERARVFYESMGFRSNERERMDHGLRTMVPHLEYRLSLREFLSGSGDGSRLCARAFSR